MFKKACVMAGMLAGLSGLALADTPIGPGATGAGGTGPNAADAKARQDKGGPATRVREDGMPVDKADANVRRDASKKDGADAGTGAASGMGGTGTVTGTEPLTTSPKPGMKP